MAEKVSENATEKTTESSRSDGVEDAVIPKGTIDPIYEEKARVLNQAVSMKPQGFRVRIDFCRFKTLEWDGINGNCSLLLVLDGQMIISGQLLLH